MMNRRGQIRPPLGVVFIGLVVCLVGGSCSTAQAEVFYVDQTSRNDGPGDDWEHAFRELDDALGASSGGDEIRIAKGTYVPTNLFDPTFRIAHRIVKGGYGGLQEPNPDQRGFVTVLSGNLVGTALEFIVGGNANHVVTVGSGATKDNTRLDGLTITGGFATEDGGPSSADGGGGVYVENNRGVTIYDCEIVDNTAFETIGGGIYCGENTNVILQNCELANNNSPAGWGGAIGSSEEGVTLTLINSRFIDNTATIVGGAVFIKGSGSVDIVNSRWMGNEAQGGGAIFNTDASITALN